MKILLSIIGLTSIGSSAVVSTVDISNNSQNINYNEDYYLESQDSTNNKADPSLPTINDRLDGGDLGFFVSKEAARRVLDMIIATTGYPVLIDDKYDGLFIVTGDESKGYTGIALYQYSLILTDITTKLPGGYLGEFSSKQNARIALDELIESKGYKVNIDDSQPFEFRLTGDESEGYTGTSTYTWAINLFDISDILEEKSIGNFNTVYDALAMATKETFKYGLMSNQVHFTVEKITNNSGAIIVTGNEENGFTGSVRWYFSTSKPDLALILFDEKSVLSANNETDAIKEVNAIVTKYNLTNAVRVTKDSVAPFSIKVTPVSTTTYAGWKQFYWVNRS